MGQQLKDLEKRLADVTAERDELRQDVEGLCLASGSSMFSRSYVITERMLAGEAELKSLRQKLGAAVLERNDLQAELTNMRLVKSGTDKALRLEKERSTQLEKELSFYQSQAAKAMADRDRAAFEADGLRAQTFKMERSCIDAERKYEYESAVRKELDSKLATCKESLSKAHIDLENKSRECAELPELRKRLKQMVESMHQLEHTTAALQGLAPLQSQLEQAQSDLSKYMAQLDAATAQNASLSAQLSAANARAASLEQQLGLAQAQAATAERSVGGMQAELADTRAQVKQLKDQVSGLEAHLSAAARAATAQQQAAELAEDAKANEVTALRQRVLMSEMEAKNLREAAAAARDGATDEQLQSTDAVEQLAILQMMVKDLKIKLAQATQEKVDALLKVAAGSTDRGGVDEMARGFSPSHSPKTHMITQGGGRPTPVPPRRHDAPHPSRSQSGSTGTSPQVSSFFFWRSANATAAHPTAAQTHLRSTSNELDDEGDPSRSGSVTDPDVSPEVALARAQDRLNAVERLAMTAHTYKMSLTAAAEVLWSPADSTAKDEALADIAALGDDLALWRTKSGASVREGQEDGMLGGRRSSQRPDALMAAEVIDLVDLCVKSLKQRNRASALSQLIRF